MPEELPNTKHEPPVDDPCLHPPSENYEKLPDTEHDLTDDEYIDILKFINTRDMCKRGLKEECKIFFKNAVVEGGFTPGI